MYSGRVWLAWAGPPPVMMKMRPNTDRVCRVMSMRLVAIAGLRIGTVTDQKRRSGPAPSIAADSYTSLGTELSAAEYTSIEKAVPLQMLAKATAMIGALNSRSWGGRPRSEEHTSELQSRGHLVC